MVFWVWNAGKEVQIRGSAGQNFTTIVYSSQFLTRIFLVAVVMLIPFPTSRGWVLTWINPSMLGLNQRKDPKRSWGYPNPSFSFEHQCSIFSLTSSIYLWLKIELDTSNLRIWTGSIFNSAEVFLNHSNPNCGKMKVIRKIWIDWELPYFTYLEGHTINHRSRAGMKKKLNWARKWGKWVGENWIQCLDLHVFRLRGSYFPLKSFGHLEYISLGEANWMKNEIVKGFQTVCSRPWLFRVTKTGSFKMLFEVCFFEPSTIASSPFLLSVALISSDANSINVSKWW